MKSLCDGGELIFELIFGKNNTWGHENDLKILIFVRSAFSKKKSPLARIKIALSGDFYTGEGGFFYVECLFHRFRVEILDV